MKTTGKITSIFRDWKTRKYVVTILLEYADPEVLTDLVDRPALSVEIKPCFPVRTISANKYFHALCTALAKAQAPPVTPDRMKNELIARYGQHEYVGEDLMVFKSNAPVEYMLEKKDIHVWPAKGGDQNTTYYYVFRGSHTYDSKEMSILIDGTVEECKIFGIDTKPRSELDKMLERWAREKDLQ